MDLGSSTQHCALQPPHSRSELRSRHRSTNRKRKSGESLDGNLRSQNVSPNGAQLGQSV